MGDSSAAGGARGGEKMDPSQLLGRLNLEEDELDDLVWEEEVVEPEEKPKWLALARVLTEKNFSQGALIGDMRGAWSPARDVVWRRINPNFSQFNSIVWQTGIKLCIKDHGISEDRR